MSKKNLFKIILDISMAVLFITFFDKNFVNMRFHMAGGIVFGLCILIHMIVNRKWIIGISKKFFDKKIRIKTKISYVISLLLLISVGLILISGFYIILAPVERKLFWKMVHYTFSYISIILIGIHIGLYWNWIMNMFKKSLKIKGKNKLRANIAKIMAVIILVCGIVTMNNQKFISSTYSGVSYISKNIVIQPTTQSENNDSQSNNSEYKQEYAKEEKSSILELASIYGSMMSVFGICTYYINKNNENKLKNKNIKSKAA